MVGPLQDDDWEGYPTGRTLLLAALFLAALYLSRHGAGAPSREWGYLLIGSATLGFTAVDLKAGRAISFYRPVSRTKEPRAFRTSIVASTTLGLAAIVFSMGAMLGYWNAGV